MLGNYRDLVPTYGLLMTVADWKDEVAQGGFIDYDGFGQAYKNGLLDPRCIWPSKADAVPEDATHILWFNR